MRELQAQLVAELGSSYTRAAKACAARSITT